MSNLMSKVRVKLEYHSLMYLWLEIRTSLKQQYPGRLPILAFLFIGLTILSQIFPLHGKSKKYFLLLLALSLGELVGCSRCCFYCGW